jgi:hypothetical protein
MAVARQHGHWETWPPPWLARADIRVCLDNPAHGRTGVVDIDVPT